MHTEKLIFPLLDDKQRNHLMTIVESSTSLYGLLKRKSASFRGEGGSEKESETGAALE